jgi:hypothetical protein
MAIETNDREVVDFIEELEMHIHVAGAMLEAARVILNADQKGKIDANEFNARPPHQSDTVQSVILEAELKISNVADAMTLFQDQDWRAHFRKTARADDE